MIINGVLFNCELEDILIELISQLRANNINLIQKHKDGPTHIQICCPYHNNGQERRPSAGLRKSDGIFHCFACNETHSLSEVISHCFGHDDDVVGKFGWQWLLRNFATVQIEERKDIELDLRRPDFMTKCPNIYVPPKYVSEEELDKYRYFHPYMYKRGLTDDIIELFDIGYDSATESITFPVRDTSGRCLFVARRSVKTKFFNYPEGVEKSLYGLYELYQQAYIQDLINLPREKEFITPSKYIFVRPFGEIIVCESMLDALSFWTVGKYAVALNGVESELQIKQLKELPCRKIILATDSDEKGMLARQRIRKKIGNRKLITEYIFPKGRKDANDCTRQELLSLEEVF